MPRRIFERLPRIEGPPIEVRFSGGLRASRDRLANDGQDFGREWPEVHAGTFLRARLTILDRALLEDSDELTRILIHELFHYAWVRLGNQDRKLFEQRLRNERAAHARGELGWSAQMRKARLRVTEGRLWSEYVCEAFCDTAAWLYSGIRAHEEFTLARRFRDARARWFADRFGARPVLV